MKLTAALMLAACLQVSAHGLSQRITIQRKNAPLETVLEEIERQSGYQFFYRSELLSTFRNVDVRLKDASLSEALSVCLKDLPLTWSIVDKTVVLQARPAVPAEATPPPPLHVGGRVLDDKGVPLEGASIRIKGTDRGTVTDKEGRYTLDVPAGAVLIFSYIGYDNTQETIRNRPVIDVTLHPSSQGLNDVVVVGYGTQRKGNVTGSVSTVKMDDVLGDRPVSTVSELMMNVVPGLNVTLPSGQPGASTSLNIRGATDLNISNSTISAGGPLIVVDNVPFNGPLNLIDPNDIETVTVLNDAGSAAIYGGRSAFGVILVTTKKGRKNQAPQFSYSNNLTIARAVNLPVKASPQQFLQSLKDMGTTSYWSGQNVALWTKLYDSIQNPGARYPNGVDYIGGVGYPLVATDMVKDLLGRSAFQMQHNLSVTGGSDKTTYRMAFGHTDENGILDPSAHQDYFKRYNLSSALSTDVTSWFTTQVNTNYFNEVLSTPSNNQFYSAVTYPTLAPIADSIAAGNGVMGLNGTPKNEITYGSPNVSKNGDLRLTGRGVLRPFQGFTLTGEYTYDNLQNNQQNYNKQLTVVTPANFQSAYTGTGLYQVLSQTTVYQSFNLYANYNRSFGNHNVTAMAGFNQEENTTSGFWTERTGVIAPGQPSISTATGPLQSADNYSAYSLRGYFGRLDYDYMGKYLLQVAGRYDGSSNFPPGHRFGFFPSGSVGWRMSKEGFMSALKPALSELKIRASFGSVGNQNISPYSYIPTISGTQPSWLTGTSAYLTGLSSPGIISSSFTWEKVETLDYGVDFGLFGNRLTGTFDWYRRDTRNILAPGATPLPADLGTGAPLENTASLRTEGYGIQLTYSDHIGNDVRFHLGVNLSDNKAWVTRFDGNPTNSLSTFYVGQHVGDIWGYTTDRFYTSDDFVSGTLNSNLTGGTLKAGVPHFQGEAPNPGDIVYKDYSGKGTVYQGLNTLDSSGDKRIIGNSNPRYVYGINGGISYKQLSFSFVITGVGKQQLNMPSVLTFPNYNQFGTVYTNELNYWTPSHTNAFYGRIYDQAAGNQSFNQQVQTRFLQNGAYLRVSNLTLDYALPARIIQMARLHGFHVFCSVENPFLFDHLPKGLEPGLTDQGSGLQYPYLRRTSFGVNLTF
ncbi:MAG TPA: TonB-dependent receptor [Dinghuibacter sp.]|uniref:TonB-dependent receptor n=1 Tax=Dinghuibacter sp. TaxID=2024697 RepID=UPI002C875C6A|nr:TonB-dependent receptor [Dinghuibacter sp.]HTJ10670.1 TonB-dependent receptor [Dinghuibacter sp.]